MNQSDLFHAGFINGRLVDGEGESVVVDNPSDESIVATFPGLSADQVQAAIRSSRDTYDSGSWSEMPIRERATVLRRFAGALASRANRLTDLVVAEGGCPRTSGTMRAMVSLPLRHALDIIDLFTTLPEFEDNPVPVAERISPQGQVVQSLRRYTSVGVVTGIAANNAPFYTALWKVMPALIAGNTIILRPNPLTPLSATVLAEAAIESSLPELRQALSLKGIDVQRIDIFAGPQSFSRESNGGQGDRPQKRGGKRGTEDDAVSQYGAVRDMGYNTIELYV